MPLDFERQTLVNVLRAAGYRTRDRAFISWLGTTQYLTDDAIFNTLREVTSLAPGSEILLQYQIAEDLLDDDNRQLLDVLKAGGSASGEPWLSLFDPPALAERVKALGFVEALSVQRDLSE